MSVTILLIYVADYCANIGGYKLSNSRSIDRSKGPRAVEIGSSNKRAAGCDVELCTVFLHWGIHSQ